MKPAAKPKPAAEKARKMKRVVRLDPLFLSEEATGMKVDTNKFTFGVAPTNQKPKDDVWEIPDVLPTFRK